jgi:hypothetical protein
MFVFKRLGFTRYESLLGIGIMAIGVLVFLPTIKQNISDIIWDEPNISAQAEAETFARSIEQFHHETGQWPTFNSDPVPVSTMMGTLVKDTAPEDSGEGLFDEKPMPLDQWDNPFLVRYIETNADDPKSHRNIMVLSKGPNGILDTDISESWYQDISRRLVHSGTDQAHLQGEPFGGDDVGFVLSRLDIGSDN